ncbi:hypothetical protein M3Y99_00088300 [Aphelenchoides fujianensis]|nr:hypothetical protein M3Y99_00088300 [Aphelenchoides fujianensis]
MQARCFLLVLLLVAVQLTSARMSSFNFGPNLETEWGYAADVGGPLAMSEPAASNLPQGLAARLPAKMMIADEGPSRGPS